MPWSINQHLMTARELELRKCWHNLFEDLHEYMKTLDTKIMRGPNYWSNYHHKLIVTLLDIEKYEDLPSNLISGFPERIETQLPSLYSHRCSHDYEGGFFERLKSGTWMGHIIEHVALELQCLAGMECGFGRTRGTGKSGIYNIVISYEIEAGGLYAMEQAILIAEALADNKTIYLEPIVKHLKNIKARYGTGPSTQSIITEAVKRGIPYRSLENGSLILFGQGIYQKKIRASITCHTSNFGVETAGDKQETKKILEDAYIPVPKGEVVSSEEELLAAIQLLAFPLAIKPVDGNHGRGITVNIISEEQAIQAFRLARNISDLVIAERFIEGEDYRLLVINNKLVAAARRTPAMIIGDGHSTVEQLIEEVNQDPRRGDGHEKVLTTIKLDDTTDLILSRKNLNRNSVLPIGQVLFVKDTANLSTGGTSTDVTEIVCPQTRFMAERVAKLIGLDVCGIDVVAKNIGEPLDGKNGVIIEVNACPGFRMHLAPAKGLARNVAEPVVDMLYPPGSKSRVPLVAITGTNGKTTTTRLTAHIAKTAGHHTGYITTDGIYIGDHLIHKGDCTGSQSAATILKDPTVDFAVLECARGGILRSGLGFDHCDISIITNVSEDHLGLTGIHTLAEMARVKEVVARSTFEHGWAILNADDDRVYQMREVLDCNIALFSIDSNNERIRRHSENGGLCATVEKDQLTILKGQWKIRICKIKNIPLSIEGRCLSMIKNILPATLVGIIQNFKIEDIRQALLNFSPSPEFTPGRMNIFSFRNFKFMIDYAHNTGGFEELKDFMAKTPCSEKVGIIAAVGDRRDEDIVNLGRLAAETFDTLIIRHDEDLRGRTKEDLNEKLLKGIGVSGRKVKVSIISKESDAINAAMKQCKSDGFIVLCTDQVYTSIQHVSGKLREEKETFKLLDQIMTQNKT